MDNIVWHQHDVDKKRRAALKGQKPCVLWFTGLSGSGKSTVAGVVEQMLAEQGRHTYLLDGDNVRHGLCRDLGFSDQDRVENIRRIGEVARLMSDAGLLVLTAFVSPFRADRSQVRELLAQSQNGKGNEPGGFIEVFVDTPLAVCEQRDPKGLYKKARAGEIPHFTGLSSPYEAPRQPEIHLHNADRAAEESAAQVVSYLADNGYI